MKPGCREAVMVCELRLQGLGQGREVKERCPRGLKTWK